MKTLEQLKDEILSDGGIDASEVQELELVLFADGKIDAEEAEFLFELNNSVSGKENHGSWGELFVKAVTSYVLDDDKSVGEIDDVEADWLFNNIQGDGQIDAVERKLLENLKNNSKNFPPKLAELLD